MPYPSSVSISCVTLDSYLTFLSLCFPVCKLRVAMGEHVFYINVYINYKNIKAVISQILFRTRLKQAFTIFKVSHF